MLVEPSTSPSPSPRSAPRRRWPTERETLEFLHRVADVAVNIRQKVVEPEGVSRRNPTVAASLRSLGLDEFRPGVIGLKTYVDQHFPGDGVKHGQMSAPKPYRDHSRDLSAAVLR